MSMRHNTLNRYVCGGPSYDIDPQYFPAVSNKELEVLPQWTPSQEFDFNPTYGTVLSESSVYSRFFYGEQYPHLTSYSHIYLPDPGAVSTQQATLSTSISIAPSAIMPAEFQVEYLTHAIGCVSVCASHRRAFLSSSKYTQYSRHDLYFNTRISCIPDRDRQPHQFIPFCPMDNNKGFVVLCVKCRAMSFADEALFKKYRNPESNKSVPVPGPHIVVGIPVMDGRAAQASDAISSSAGRSFDINPCSTL